MSDLIVPHGKEEKLIPLLLQGDALKAETERAKGLKSIKITSRETSDLIMLGIGAFTPLTGFMSKADWQGVCDKFLMADGTFWPIPVTVSTSEGQANSIKKNQEIALVDEESGELMATMKVKDKYKIDKAHECKQVFKTTEMEHPGVVKVMNQEEIPQHLLGETFGNGAPGEAGVRTQGIEGPLEVPDV